MTAPKHPLRPHCLPAEPSLEQLAHDLGDLRYDALSAFLGALADKLQWDGEADGRRGRTKLSVQLLQAASDLRDSACGIKTAWKICEPHMRGDDER